MTSVTCVLQDWVIGLPLREQGTLLTGARGCDLTPKLPLDSTERQLVGFLRFCFMNPADPREVGYVGGFFQPSAPADWRQSELGHYPLHWVSHLAPETREQMIERLSEDRIATGTVVS